MNIFVKTLYWSKNVMPEAGDYPQSIINKQILDKSDAIIAIFGNKIGSPTQHYESGTIEEIELMIQKRKTNGIIYIIHNSVDNLYLCFHIGRTGNH